MANGKSGKRYYQVSGGIIPAPDLPCLYEDFARRVANGDDVIPWPFAECDPIPPPPPVLRTARKASSKRRVKRS